MQLLLLTLMLFIIAGCGGQEPVDIDVEATVAVVAERELVPFDVLSMEEAQK